MHNLLMLISLLNSRLIDHSIIRLTTESSGWISWNMTGVPNSIYKPPTTYSYRLIHKSLWIKIWTTPWAKDTSTGNLSEQPFLQNSWRGHRVLSWTMLFQTTTPTSNVPYLSGNFHHHKFVTIQKKSVMMVPIQHPASKPGSVLYGHSMAAQPQASLHNAKIINYTVIRKFS